MNRKFYAMAYLVGENRFEMGLVKVVDGVPSMDQVVKKGTRFVDQGLGFYDVVSDLQRGDVLHGTVGFSSDNSPSMIPTNIELRPVAEGDANLYGLRRVLDSVFEYSSVEEE